MSRLQTRDNGALRVRLGQVILVVVGVVNLIPLLPLMSPRLLDALYRVVPVDATTELLLRHRALVLGLVGVGLVVSAFRTSWRTGSLAVAAVVNGSYALLAVTGGTISAAATRVMLVDVVVLLLLAAAAALLHQPRRGRPAVEIPRSTYLAATVTHPPDVSTTIPVAPLVARADRPDPELRRPKDPESR